MDGPIEPTGIRRPDGPRLETPGGSHQWWWFSEGGRDAHWLEVTSATDGTTTWEEHPEDSSAPDPDRFQEVDALKTRLDAYRPLDADKVRAIDEKFRLEWTYHSNALEGNTLSLSETSFFLKEGLTVRGKPVSMFLEAQNHVEAVLFLESIVAGQRPLTEGVVKELHALLFKGVDTIRIGPPGAEVTKRIEPGKYKSDNNHVVKLDDSIHQYVDFLQVPGEMESLLGWYAEAIRHRHAI